MMEAVSSISFCAGRRSSLSSSSSSDGRRRSRFFGLTLTSSSAVSTRTRTRSSAAAPRVGGEFRVWLSPGRGLTGDDRAGLRSAGKAAIQRRVLGIPSFKFLSLQPIGQTFEARGGYVRGEEKAKEEQQAEGKS